MILHWQVPDSLVHSEVEFMGILLARGPVGNFVNHGQTKPTICLEGSNRIVFLFVCLASTINKKLFEMFFSLRQAELVWLSISFHVLVKSFCLTMDGDIVGGRNPAPSGMYKTPMNSGINYLSRCCFQIFFIFPHPYLGKIPILTNIFQRG